MIANAVSVHRNAQKSQQVHVLNSPARDESLIESGSAIEIDDVGR